jgi:hypothetical protein
MFGCSQTLAGETAMLKTSELYDVLTERYFYLEAVCFDSPTHVLNAKSGRSVM